MKNCTDEIMEGAIEIHAHIYPEFSNRVRGRVTTLDWVNDAIKYNMGGIVLKSHTFPTIYLANLLQEIRPELKIFGSITMNSMIGGINPINAQMAGELGAKVVWMPTWSSRNDFNGRRIFLTRMQNSITSLSEFERYFNTQSILDIDNNLTNSVKNVVDIAKKYDMSIASGHLSIEESKILGRYAAENNVKFVLTHALSGTTNATIEDQKYLASLGCFIEHVFVTTMPMHQRLEPKFIANAIKEVGADKCILATDCIYDWNPSPPEMLRMFISSMLALGITKEELRKMVYDNPRQLLGIKEHCINDD